MDQLKNKKNVGSDKDVMALISHFINVFLHHYSNFKLTKVGGGTLAQQPFTAFNDEVKRNIYRF